MPFYPLLSLHFSENVPPVCPSTCPSTTQNRPFRAQKKGAVKLPEQPKIIPKIPSKSSPAYNIIRTPSEYPKNCVLSPHSSLTDTSSITISNRRTPLCFSAFRNIYAPISRSSSAPLSDLAVIALPPEYKPYVNPM